MSETTKEKKKEVLDYAIEMRERGDRFLTIRNYVDSKIEDKEVVKQIMEVLNRMDLEGKVVRKDITKRSKATKNRDTFFGSVLILGGVVMGYLLWGAGYFALFSLGLIFGGILVIAGVHDNFFPKL